MSDIEEIPVETVAGHRPASAVGDRLMIGLAAVALLGGGLIALGNLVSTLSDEAAVASPSAPVAATTRPDRTPRPSPTLRPLREVGVIPGEPPERPDDGYVSPLWVQALEEQPIREAPYADSGVLDVLPAGAVVLASDQGLAYEPWLSVDEGASHGWIRLEGNQGRPLATALSAVQGFQDGGATAVSAGPTGFVANVVPAARGWGEIPPMTVSSPDGEHWSVATGMKGQPPWGRWAAAWGPSGWLAVSSVDTGGITGIWVWESRDGSTWTPLGGLGIGPDQSVSDFTASDLGYLLSVSDAGQNAIQHSLWFSADGLAWQESDVPVEVGGDYYRPSGPSGLRLHATSHGYLAWGSGAEYAPVEMASSPNGRDWRTTSLSTEGIAMFQIATVGDRVMGLGLDERGRTRAWHGRLGADGAELAAAPHLELAFDGAIVTALTTDGERAYAFGYAREDGSSRAWVSSGLSWLRFPVPDAGFGAIPRVVAAGPEGVVVVGARANLVASSPVLWHARPDGSWRVEEEPVVPALPEPGSEEDCPALPATAFEFMTAEPAVAVACFGDQPLSFVAWSADCHECWGDPGAQSPGAWLREPAPFFMLLPYQGIDDSGWWRQAVPHRALEWDDEWSGAWLRITGHYDDPAAEGCGAGPMVGEEAWWEGPELNVRWCRQVFVVTEADRVRHR